MKTEKLNVEFYGCEVGWLRLKISAVEKCVNLSFSHCFDPLPDLKCWLEAIALGVEQTSFSYNPEGDIIKFDFLETAYSVRKTENDDPPISFSTHEINIFSLSFPFYGNDKIFAHNNATLEMIMSNKTIPNEQDKIFFKTWIDRKQLVEAFYNGLTNFYLSDNYKKEEWEYQSFDKVLCEKLNFNHKQLVNYLLTISEKDIKVLLSENDKSGYYTPDDFHLHENYNSLPSDEKNAEIEKYLKWNTSHWGGMPLSEFKSEIIENYLKE